MPAELTARRRRTAGRAVFLAIGVFFTHVIAVYGYYSEGRWYSTFAPVYMNMGQVGVSIFFMITGFLFWRRALRSKDGVDAKALYVSRIRRLVPMYVVSPWSRGGWVNPWLVLSGPIGSTPMLQT